MAFDLSGLNENQRASVLDTEGAVLVTAGAGSGKTRLLTHRIAHLIENCKISPYRILAITFTNKAANEMKERIESMLGADAFGVWVSTFHSMCVTMLRRYCDKIGYGKSFSIYGETEKERLIKKLLKEDAAVDDTDKDVVKEIIWAISDAKNKGLNPEQYYQEYGGQHNSDLILSVYTAYEAELKKSNAFDFDDLLIKTLEMLIHDKEAREYYQEKFLYIHVDEFQDTNAVQYGLVKVLALKHRNIMVVGDEDQSIYGWRGADIANIRDFIQDFRCKKYVLEQNYRSTKKILTLANKVITHNEDRIEKTLWTENDEGDEPAFHLADSEAGEADFVVYNIKKLHDQGYGYSDIAVLMRLNALTRSFEERFMQYGIPYRVTGGFKFYDRKEIKDILAYLRLTANPSDTEALLRVINFPKRGIGESAVAQLMNYCSVTGENAFSVVVNIKNNTDLPKALCKKLESFSAVLNCLKESERELNIADFTKYLVRLLDLKTVYESDTEENENRKLNIKELVNSMESFVKLNPKAGIDEYLQTVSLYSDTDDMDGSAGFVQIATVHSAKGLEFPCVFIVGLEEGIFPLSRCTDSKKETEEERRLCYVAITRAKKRLYLSYASTRFLYGSRKYSVPSRFLTEIGYAIPARKQPAEFREYGNKHTVGTMPVITLQNSPRNDNLEIDRYKTGMLVKHKKFGFGIIVSVSGTPDNCFAEIEFESVGKLNLSLNYAPLELMHEE